MANSKLEIAFRHAWWFRPAMGVLRAAARCGFVPPERFVCWFVAKSVRAVVAR